jgi:hypothetical protein
MLPLVDGGANPETFYLPLATSSWLLPFSAILDEQYDFIY